MALTPAYASTPRFGSVTISSADTNRGTPSSVGTILTAGSSGTRIDSAVIQATGTTTQGIVRLWVYDGSAYSLIKEIEVRPVTPSATVLAFAAGVTFDGGLCIPSGHSLRATTHNAESFRVAAFGADF